MANMAFIRWLIYKAKAEDAEDPVSILEGWADAKWEVTNTADGLTLISSTVGGKTYTFQQQAGMTQIDFISAIQMAIEYLENKIAPTSSYRLKIY